MQHEKEFTDDTVENNRRVNERAMSLRSRVEDGAPEGDPTPVSNSEQQMNWSAQQTAMPVMTPSAVPAMPLGRPVVPDTPQPGSAGMSGIDAICGYTDNLGWGRK